MPIPKQTIAKKATIPFQVAIRHVFQPMHNSRGEVVSLLLQPETEIRNWLRAELKRMPWIVFTEDPQLSKFVGTYCGYRFCVAIENLDAYNHVLYYYGTQEILTTWDPYCVIKRHDKLPPLPENLSTSPLETPQTHTMLANQYRWLRNTMSKRYVPVFDYPWQMYGGVYRTSPADLRGITMASYAFFRGLGGEGRTTPLPQPWK
mmetsp:Transcript_2376/g.5477  ORF Transcript_2376/g.5477 Transcript_2376/m.5477 type:complete len:204 (+) Transcript_2376:1377-1988(+)|eukprot:CAMPEP_0171490800 /NCGR_PEP_ID=MMETSP0958-20121227/3508_1 /TAXON_ID=87120 /ORGANISM="Aurantiochytrium limacinum, Strain ATCCMYA-1381" /LENGTH=203 /DNA_ID=CAMNT_0012024153 /DNA_START=1916 /DNA_END=2527 /DNA_ORIENTATION=+